MKDSEVTYPKFPSNFGELNYGALSRSYYHSFSAQNRSSDADRLTNITGVPLTSAQTFECAYGSLRYNYSHFPGNCGIGTYSSISRLSLKTLEYPQATREELAHKIYQEFVHYIRHYSDKDMILLSDRTGGMVESLVKQSDGQIKPVGEPVLNKNSRNTIQLYQTTRIVADNHEYFPYRKLQMKEITLIPKTDAVVGDYFTKFHKQVKEITRG